MPGEVQHHWQEQPLIAIIFEVQPLDKQVQNTYFDLEEKRQFFKDH